MTRKQDREQMDRIEELLQVMAAELGAICRGVGGVHEAPGNGQVEPRPVELPKR